MRRLGIGISVVALVTALLPATVMAAGEGITINEIRIDQPGGDADEYFELSGAPDSSLDGLTYLVIGDDSEGSSGVIEHVTELNGNSIASDGLFLTAEPAFTLGTADAVAALNFENSDNVTHMLVSDFSGSNGDDLDIDDDGTLDVTPWSAIVDSVALVESSGSGERIYSDVEVGPDGSFVPAHVFECPGVWLIGSFGIGADTPGEPNECEPVTAKIHEVQGPGFTSPLAGKLVRIEGVVVGDFQGNTFAGSQLGGFHLQEEPDDQDTGDGADLTSEGVFVLAPGGPNVEIGDVVEVTGLATESFGLTQISPVTELSVTGAYSGPDLSTEMSLPITGDIDFEKVEGMLVTFPQDLYISEFFNFDRFGEIVLTTDRQYQGTHVALPGSPANAVADANELARIMLDDGRDGSNPDPAIHPNGEEFTLTNTFRGGDILQGVTGAMHYSFGNYKIQPTEWANYTSTNQRPTRPDPVGGDVRVATFNVLNFFTNLDEIPGSFNGPFDCGPTATLECRGANSEEEYERQLAKLVAGIISLDADIVGIQEIENDIRLDDGNRAHDAVLTLVEELNRADRGATWEWVGETNHYNDYPVRNEIIYRKRAVSLVGAPVALADEAFDQTRGDDIEPVGRPPLAQTFRAHGKGAQLPFTVIVNHFKSKGSDCDDLGDPDVGDGQANCSETRVDQSEALLDFAAGFESDSPSGILIIGDLNSYAMEDPIRTLEDAGFTDLLEDLVGPDAYTYVFDGQLGYLDYVMANDAALERVTGVTSFHINADEPDIFDYDTTFKKDAQDALYEPLPYRVSDHDPVIVGLEFSNPRRPNPRGND